MARDWPVLGYGDVCLADVNDLLRLWSASLPAILRMPARPWNGRTLTPGERVRAYEAYVAEGPQAAYEWLSEYAP